MEFVIGRFRNREADILNAGKKNPKPTLKRKTAI